MRLSEHHTVIMYDRYGTGLSDRDRSDFTLECDVHDLEVVVDSLELEQFDLLSISEGGPVGTAFAAAHPERVRRLVLYSTYAVGASTASSQDEHEACIGIIRSSWGRIAARVITDLLAPRAPAELVDGYARLLQNAVSPENVIAFSKRQNRTDVTGLLPAITAPTLVLKRRDDAVPPLAQSRMLAAAIRNAQLELIDGDAHLPAVGDVAGLANAILRFLAEGASEVALDDGGGAAGRQPLTGYTSATYPDGLTPRELEVLQLLAAGKSNRQIADDLVISLNTAERHVSNIYAKTGVSNRVEAASWAREHGPTS